ncbi:hypothetical protein Makalu002_107 [Escherichia phage Ec_Makalu_002]|uniref:Uncharacterized protein n=1 Tax=Escherichia phage Ec_Makalu_002 TaxID=2682770 RepID=A0A650DFY8_9CAUD|nr:hypothetical protein Makalu002_107 [Escherichia phage Ec_Makalu_002]
MIEQMLTATVMAFCMVVVMIAMIPKERMSLLVAVCVGVVCGWFGIALEQALR